MIRRLREMPWKARLCAALGFAALGVAVLLWIVPLFYAVPNLDAWQPPGVTVRDRNGFALAHLPSPDHYRGSHTPYELLPPDLVAATLAAEDKRFFSHGGVDFAATLRAAWSQIAPGVKKSGASTVTQQLVKLSSLPSPRTLPTKFREIMTARRMEMTIDKRTILAAYFDRLDYGNLRTGPGAAAEYYFGRRPDQLSLAQTALLAGLPQSPSRLNPMRNPEQALTRRNWILSRLQEEFHYDPARIERAKKEPLELAARPDEPVLAPHLLSKIMRENAASGETHTTLDAGLQQEAQRAVADVMASLSDRRVTQAAVIVLHNPTGEILAWVGSSSRRDPRGGQLDGALTPRSAGSTLKPFVYALAFGQGHWAGEVLADVPVTYRTANGFDAPKNYNNDYRGPLSAREALACSQNIPAMSLLESSGGPDELVALLRRLGFATVDRAPSHYGLGLAIGNAEVRLFDLVNAYGVLARRGLAFDSTWKRREQLPAPRRVMNEDACFVVTDILADNRARTAAFGPASPLAFDFPCAAKTGTSSDYRDNWCVGYTAEVTVGVWVGNFDFSRMRDVSGVSGAGPVFHRIMEQAHRRYPSSFPPPSPGVVRVRIDQRNGLLCEDGPHAVTEWAFRDSLPQKAGADDYDEQGRAVLDSRYRAWFVSESNRLSSLYGLSPRCWGGESPRIIVPPDQSTLAIDPELPGGGRIVRLHSNLPDGADWQCETLKVVDDNGHPAVELEPGVHTIRAIHPQEGLSAESTVRVIRL